MVDNDHPDFVGQGGILQRQVLDALPDLIAYLSADGCFRFANRAYQTWFGLTDEQIVGRPYAEVLGTEAAERARPYVERALRGETAEYVARMPYRHGPVREIEGRIIPYVRADGSIPGVFGLIRDVSEGRRHSEEMREVVDGFEEGFFALDADGRYTMINESAARMLAARVDMPDFDRGQFIGVRHSETVPRSESGVVMQAFRRVSRSKVSESLRFPSAISGAAIAMRVFPTSNGGAGFIFWDATPDDIAEAARRESEARLSAIADNMPSGMVYQIEVQPGGEWRFTYVAQSSERLNGISAEEAIAKPRTLRLLIIPEDLPVFRTAMKRAMATLTPLDREVRMRRPDGELRWARLTSIPRPQPDGSVLWDGLQIDITEQKLAQQTLQRNEQRLRLALDTARMFAWEYDIADGAVFVSDNLVAVVGMPLPLGGFTDQVHPEDWPAVARSLAATLERAEPTDLECRFAQPGADGWIWINMRAVRIDGPDGQPQRMVGVAIDVSDRRRRMDALRESEARFRLTADSAPAFMWMSDTDGKLLFLNRFAIDFFGQPVERLMDHMRDFEHPDDAPAIRQMLTDSGVRGEGFSYEARYRRFDGQWRWLRCEGAPRLDEQGRLLGYTGCNIDITETREASELLARANLVLTEQVRTESAEKAQALLTQERFWEISKDLFAVVGRSDASVRAINATAWEATLGHPAGQLSGSALFGLVHPDDMARTGAFGEDLREGRVSSLENRHRHADGSWRWLSWNVIPEGDVIYCVARDITEDKLREEQVRRSQKLEALGQLTGGVAHDFNNLLTAIMGALDLVQKRPDDARLRERLIGAALSAAKRGERLNKQLLGFARRQAVNEEFVALGPMLEEMRPLIRGAVGDAIRLELGGSAGDAGAVIDPAQFEAAILNLVVNARDAMPAGGELRIDVRHAAAAELAKADLAIGGQYLVVQVRDSGTGLSEEALAHAFEPFFTTKEIGKGSGLGLAHVYGFARQSRGGVVIESEPGQGAAISILLPAAQHQPRRPADPERIRSSRRRRILLVEDDSLVGVVTETMLIDLGHVVTRAEDAEEALSELSRGSFDLLMTDIRMPGGMNGVQLARRVTQQAPQLCVLLCSGWAEDVLIDEIDGARWPMLTKPFDVAQLERAIYDALAHR
jgi:PAS domain S-box-containing protein